MLGRHLLFTLRLFGKDRVYSLFNLFGLSVALSSCIILILYLWGNLNYDKHYEGHENVYRFEHIARATGVEFRFAGAPEELGPIFLDEIPGVEQFVRINAFDNFNFLVEMNGEERLQNEKGVIKTDSVHFDLFPAKFIQGQPEAFRKRGSAVLSESAASRLFSGGDAVGKILKDRDGVLYTVVGIMEDQPENTHLKYNIVLNYFEERTRFATDENGNLISEVFWNPTCYLYVKFTPGYDPEKFGTDFKPIYNKYFKEFGDRINGSVEVFLVPLARVHFHSGMDFDEPQGNMSYVITLASIGFLILLLASINYMNLSTARSAGRVGEIGIRKALGFDRRDLFWLLFSESMVLSFIATVISVGIVAFILNLTPFNQLIGYELQMNLLQDTWLWPVLILIWLGIGLLSGLYPAWYVSSFPLVSSLKGTFTETRSAGLRRVLLIFQLAISATVISLTLFMNQQMEFIENTDLGFDREHIMLVPLKDSVARAHGKVLKDALLSMPEVNSVTSSNFYPGGSFGEQVMKVEDASGEMTNYQFKNFSVSEDYVKTMGIEIIDGRDFDSSNEGDYNLSFLLNESAVKALGWETDPVSKRISYFHGEDQGKVIGIFKNMHINSLHESVAPMFIVMRHADFPNMAINFNKNGLSDLLEKMRDLWSTMPMNYSFDYSFLNDELGLQYEQDRLQFRLVQVFSIVCILVSLLGVLGTTSFDASRKTREIGIRKSMGASSKDILIHFVGKYAVPMIVAGAVSIPVSNFLVTEWLKNFQFAISIQWAGYIFPVLGVSVLVVLIVVLNSWKSANLNPTYALRSE